MKKIRFKHLSIEERYKIKDLRGKGFSLSNIADYIGRSKSTVSTEITRNKCHGVYMPCVAHEQYKQRKHAPHSLKIEEDPILLAYIVDGMKIKKWSPDVIAGKLKLDRGKSVISHESIYRFIYTSLVARRLMLHEHLPSRRLKRESRGKRRHRQIIPQRVSIHERDPVASHKLQVGHFEADLTFHKGNQSRNIGAMVDKKTQKIMLVLNRSKRALTVTTGFLKKINSLPKSLRRTITMDNGKEFVGHIAFRLSGFSTYFCDPYSPRQKALIEKMNSMIHRILPKRIDINTITQEMLDEVAEILNNMPRKIFGYKTPNEIWAENI